MLVFRTAKKYGLIRVGRERKKVNYNFSFCDYCGRNLNWWENVPVASWLFLGGKTSCCHKRLPLSYPVVEVVMALAFLAGYLTGGDNKSVLGLAVDLLILTGLVFSGVFDFKYMILPDFSTLWLIMLAGVKWVALGGQWQNLVAVVGMAGLFLGLYGLTKGKGMGMGDVKLAVFMGLFLGIRASVVALYLAFVTGAVVGVVGIILGKIRAKSIIPFGPFLIGATVVSWWWGQGIWDWVAGNWF